MHDGNELCSESGLYISDNVFHSRGDGVVSSEWGVNDDTQALHLEVGLVQSLERTAVVKVVIEWNGKVGVCDCSGKGSMFGGGEEQAESDSRWGC